MANDRIYPGKTMLDINGRRIQAHGGSIFYDNGVYHFYGENKEKTTKRGKIWSWGVRSYSSNDLYNWKDEGLIIPPDLKNKRSLLHPYHYLDRPHIVRSHITKKYVCWIKFSAKKESCFLILVADNFLGPYSVVKTHFRPYGLEVGDFDIYQDKKTNKTYLYFANGAKGIVACELSADCVDVVGNYKVYYQDLVVPFCREGIAVFEYKNHLYMLTSGMTGYVPNPSQVAKMSSPLGELTELGNPHSDDESGSSFHSQISTVFTDPKNPNVLIALADRWVPDIKFTKEKSEKMMRAIAACMSKKYHAKLGEIISLAKLPLDCKKVNTSVSDYVWLPVQIQDGKPIIKWYDEWSIEELVEKERK